MTNLLHATARLCACIQPSVDQLLQIALEPLSKMLEHCRTARKDDVLWRMILILEAKGAARRTDLVQSSPNVDGRLLNNSINDLRERSQEIGRVNLGVKEDFGRKESLVSNVDAVWLCGFSQHSLLEIGVLEAANLARDRILSIVLDKVLVRFPVILSVLLHDVLTHVAIRFLHLSSNLQLILGGYDRQLPSFSHQIQHKLADVSTSDGNMLDGAPDHVPLSTRDNVRDTIARVNDRSSERAIRDLVRGPGSSKG